ncbi:rRNA maturation RNase YbeY [Alteromonas sp. 5E99-2]|uniref:rRNA maturation RNase YbeY n=1 Tax=Alteromonas sp. 5E99-2 TaxID=2817683 RepID=UPI001A989B65|nr:rRNA maturation RNase YbeY [Alteromonas sp. 5E99-2]MBO1255472.1 rRNA maturation RNase YbeY [Alteromonas sp. 5E99-2]
MPGTPEKTDVLLDRQVSDELDDIHLPTEDDIEHWLAQVFAHEEITEKEITVRFVDANESQMLNSTYRNKDKPTNVLSFPFEAPPGIDVPLLGDLVVCQAIIEKEAQQQNKHLNSHYAHMIVHGCLHLLGYDHIEDDEAEHMESIEIALLANLNIDDPYQEL